MPNPLQDKLNTLDEEAVAKLYKTVFDSEEAQLILEDLRNRCFVKTTTAIGDPYYTHFYEGMRAAFLHIQTQINYDPEEKESDE